MMNVNDRPHQAICDTGLMLLGYEVPDSEEVEIKKGMVFDTLEHLKYFLMDYAIGFTGRIMLPTLTS